MLDQIELGRRLGRFDVDFSGGLAARPRTLSESLALIRNSTGI